MTDSDLLAEIEARASAAIEGPWECIYDEGDDVSIRIEGESRGFYTEIASTGQWAPDFESSPTAEFIAHARVDVPWLIDRIRELELTVDNMGYEIQEADER